VHVEAIEGGVNGKKWPRVSKQQPLRKSRPSQVEKEKSEGRGGMHGEGAWVENDQTFTDPGGKGETGAGEKQGQKEREMQNKTRPVQMRTKRK